jgi:hypothetical protein
MASVENTMRQQPLQSMDTTRLHFIDNDDTSSSTLTEHTLMICRRPHSTSPEISEGVKVQVSLMNDEFADIQWYVVQLSIVRRISLLNIQIVSQKHPKRAPERNDPWNPPQRAM